MVPAVAYKKYPTMLEVVEEVRKITDIAFPIAAMSLVGYLRNMIMVICMGRLGSLELAGGALAIGFTNITGYSVLSGLAMGMESVCSQALGSQNHSLASLTLQRTILMSLLASVPIGLIWFNLEPLMINLNQDPEITRIASIYCRFAVPDLAANSILYPLRIYLRSKGATWPLMWCSLASTVFHLPIAFCLAFKLSLGVQGIAISTFITNFSTVVLLLHYTFTYTCYSRKPRFEPLYEPLLAPPSVPPTFSAAKDWAVLIRLALPSCLGVCLEWWWYEFMTILAGYLPSPRVALASAAIVIQTTSLMYTLPTALSASVSTRVGHELGARQPRKARLASVVAIGLALLTSLFGLLLTTVGRGAWARAFTDDSQVLRLTIVVLPIIGLCELANCPQTTSCGILRGTARPGIGAAINFYAFYLVGAPVAVAVAFALKLGFVGLCYGLLAAQVACVVSVLTVVFTTDWERVGSKVEHLVGKSDGAFRPAHPAATCEQGIAGPLKQEDSSIFQLKNLRTRNAWGLRFCFLVIFL